MISGILRLWMFPVFTDDKNEISVEMETEKESESLEDADKIVIIDPDSEVRIFSRNF